VGVRELLQEVGVDHVARAEHADAAGRRVPQPDDVLDLDHVAARDLERQPRV